MRIKGSNVSSYYARRIKQFLIHIKWNMKKIFLAVTTLTLLSCSKNKSSSPQMILETSPNTIFSLYASKSDWKNEVNPIIKTQAGSDGKIILKNLTSNASYYFDMYSGDSLYSNWQSRRYNDLSKVQLIYNSGGTNIHQPDALVWKLLLGKEKQTKWKLIDVRDLDGTGSIWSTMTDCEKDKELIFQKDFICILSERSKVSGCTNPITDNYDFYVYIDGSQIYLRLTGAGIPDDTYNNLIDVIEETVGATKIKRLKVYDLFNNSKVGIFTKE